MINDFDEEKVCTYKGELYLVRDNGAVKRITPAGKKERPLDNQWTFGHKNASNGYMTIGEHRVHIIVATAFYGEKDTSIYVVDHIDTNRCNNRADNLRWFTRLENALQNEITRKKIEWICGSVESFLRNPEQLRGFECKDSNFEWMRAVSKEEAENALNNLKNISNKPKTKLTTNTNRIGDWIFSDSIKFHSPSEPVIIADSKPDNLLNHKTEAERYQEELEISKERQLLEIEKMRCILEQKRLDEKNAKKREQTSKKNAVKNSILNIAKAEGWDVSKNVSGNGWKADLLIISNECRIGIKLFASTMHISDVYQAMKSDNVKGCWLGSSFKNYGDDILYPSFEIEVDGEEVYVRVHETLTLPIKGLLKAIISGHLRVEEYIYVRKIKVRFQEKYCYWCDARYFYYFVNGVICEKFPSLADHDGIYRNDITVDDFDPIVIDGVKKFLKQHPELNYLMGEIKERYSRTMEQTYMSFGCPKCDGIFGQHYLLTETADLMYLQDDEFVHEIELEEPGLKLKLPHWVLI